MSVIVILYLHSTRSSVKELARRLEVAVQWRKEFWQDNYASSYPNGNLVLASKSNHFDFDSSKKTRKAPFFVVQDHLAAALCWKMCHQVWHDAQVKKKNRVCAKMEIRPQSSGHVVTLWQLDERIPLPKTKWQERSIYNHRRSTRKGKPLLFSRRPSWFGYCSVPASVTQKMVRFSYSTTTIVVVVMIIKEVQTSTQNQRWPGVIVGVNCKTTPPLTF